MTWGDVIFSIIVVALGWLMAWIIFSVPEARGESPEIVLSGPVDGVAAKVCFEDATEAPGPPKLPVCFGPDEWDIVAAPDYPDVNVTLYVETGRVGLEAAIYALKIVSGARE